MKKQVKFSFFTAIILILIGAVIFTVAMSANNWDFKKLSTFEYETNTYKFGGQVQDIIIETTTADVTIVPAAISATYCVVECYELEKAPHTVSFEDGNLVIKEADNRQWYDYIGVNFGSPKITVYVTAQMFDKIQIHSTTGDIAADMLSANSIDLSVSTGDITLSNTHSKDDINISVTTGDLDLSNSDCKNLKTTGSTGKVRLNDVVAEDTLTVKRSTGDVKLEGIDGQRIDIKVGTGDVHGWLLSGKVFTVKTSTGNISVPENYPHGSCHITTTTGDIRITTF